MSFLLMILYIQLKFNTLFRNEYGFFGKETAPTGRPQIGKNRFWNHLFRSITTKKYSNASALLYFSLLHLSEKSVSQNCFCTLKESSFDANSDKKRRHPVGWRAFLTPICAKMLLLGRIFPNWGRPTAPCWGIEKMPGTQKAFIKRKSRNIATFSSFLRGL